MKKLALLLVAVTLLVASPSISYGGIDGNALLIFCNEAIKLMDDENSTYDVERTASCVYYVNGARAMHDLLKTIDKIDGLYCIPEGNIISTGQSIKILVKYLQEHPEELHNPAIMSVAMSHREAFPCP